MSLGDSANLAPASTKGWRSPDEVSDHRVVAVAQQRTGELSAHIAETDETDLHGRPPVVGALVGCGIVRHAPVSTMLFAQEQCVSGGRRTGPGCDARGVEIVRP